LLDYDSDRESWRGRKDKKGKSKKKADAEPEDQVQEVGPTKASKMVVKIDNEITVFELAKAMGTKATDLIKQLMSLGVMASINQMIDFDTATLVASEFGFTTQNVGSDDEGFLEGVKADESEENFELRPPVVTVMGHVDHGKTSLLDAIRNTSVTDSEAGGITQHIGAYTVKTTSGGRVAFIDTPGHAAFTEMRGRGAKVTDIVVLVVAADDGVMPQTIEAINHAKAAEVPIIVAINKMDKEDANPDRVRQQLAEYDLIPEDWGGETIMVPVSAHTREGLDDLLENLALQAEILELKADPNRAAVGTVIESRVDRGRGPVMTVLVQKGTLKVGEIFVAGSVSGRVRAMLNHAGKACETAGPSVPVEVLGASAAPLAGEEFIVLSSEAEAKRIAEQKSVRMHARALAEKGGVVHGAPLTLENFASMAGSEDLKELALIIKADVQGTVEAVAQSLGRLSNEEVTVKVIHKGVGAITENDVQLATASKAVVIGFNVRAEPRAAEAADIEGVSIEYSRVIYELVELVEAAINGLKAPVFREKSLGRVEVRETFKVPKFGVIAGSYVLDGTVRRGARVRLLRDNVVVYEGKMGSLRRFKDDVKEVQAGYECGVSIEGYTDIKGGDIIEVFTVEQVPVV
jgi:translation initiation factor IF-2